MLPDTLQAEICMIRADNTSGAVDLVRRTAGALRTAGNDPAVVQEFCLAAVSAQPAMAPLVNLTNAVLFGLDRAESPGDICDRFLALLASAGDQISGYFVDLLEDGMTLLTHSSSRTVLDALRAASGVREDLTVICTESRPMGEGIALARILSEAGLGVRVVTDASVWRVMEQSEMVICGADSITSRGLVNKTGTTLIALAAREFGRPVYALCGSQKFLPIDYSLPPEQQHPAKEILGEELARISHHGYR
jgi:translation initiation factor eIF-2B subunit delta